MQILLESVLSSETLAIVRALESNPRSNRRPHAVEDVWWAPRGRPFTYRSDWLVRRFPTGLRSAFGTMSVDTRAEQIARLLDLGVRPAALRPITTEEIVRRRSGLLDAERKRSRLGPIPTPRSIFRYHEQATFANAWIDVFSVDGVENVSDVQSMIGHFIAAWYSYNLLFGNETAGFDLTDAWILVCTEASGELEIVPCRHTGSTFYRPFDGHGVSSPWHTRGEKALLLRRRLAAYAILHGLGSYDLANYGLPAPLCPSSIARGQGRTARPRRKSPAPSSERR